MVTSSVVSSSVVSASVDSSSVVSSSVVVSLRGVLPLSNTAAVTGSVSGSGISAVMPAGRVVGSVKTCFE